MQFQARRGLSRLHFGLQLPTLPACAIAEMYDRQ